VDTSDRARELLATVPQAGCLWAAQRPDGGRVVLVTDGLPSGQEFCALLDGGWVLHGWECIVV
jgi:phosphomannomutase